MRILGPAALLCALTALCGCLNLKQPAHKIQFYMLDYDAPAASRPRLPAVLRVVRFSAAPDLDARKIVYQDGPYRRDAYVYHQWRVPPAGMVRYFLARDLRASGAFLGVTADDGALPVTHLIEGTVDAFMKTDGPDGWRAVIRLTLVLADADERDVTRKILFQKTYEGRTPCEAKTPAALAGAMSRAMAGVSRQALADVYDALSADPPEAESS